MSELNETRHSLVLHTSPLIVTHVFAPTKQWNTSCSVSHRYQISRLYVCGLVSCTLQPDLRKRKGDQYRLIVPTVTPDSHETSQSPDTFEHCSHRQSRADKLPYIPDSVSDRERVRAARAIVRGADAVLVQGDVHVDTVLEAVLK